MGVLFGETVLAMFFAIMAGEEGSALGHLHASTSGLQVFLDNPLGSGLGSAGTFSSALGENNFGNSENAYLNLGIQVGFLGVASFILLIFCVLFNVFQLSKNGALSANSNFAKFVFVCCLAFFISGFLSPQIWAVRTSTFFWLLAGIAIRQLECVDMTVYRVEYEKD